MKRWVLSLLLTGLGMSAASGQTVFFDQFEGDTLLPHWAQPPPSHWEYSVNNSQLHVEELLWPSSSKSPSNYTGISTRITPLEGDFRVHVRMGWEANSFPVMRFALQNSLAQRIAGFGYSSGEIRAEAGLSQPFFFPAPPPGLHDFVVDRVGSQVNFTLNGELLLTLPDTAPGDLELFSFHFLGPYPDPGLDPLHVDLVHIVPAPSVMLALMITGGIAMTRRRHECPAHRSDWCMTSFPHLPDHKSGCEMRSYPVAVRG